MRKNFSRINWCELKTYVWESITSICSVFSGSGEMGTGVVGVIGVVGAVSMIGDSVVQLERFHKNVMLMTKQKVVWNQQGGLLLSVNNKITAVVTILHH